MRLDAVFSLMAGLLTSTSGHPIARSGTTLETIPQGISRGMWVWNTAAVVQPNGQTAAILQAAQQAQITDLYMYMAPNDYTTKATQMRAFITQANNASIRVWGLDGDRGYLNDGSGPAPLYAGINNLLAYNNATSSAAQKFFGFQADVEPQDSEGYSSFHNGIADTALSTAAGTGVWQTTQALDREMLMRSWLTIHQTAQSMLHTKGLRFSAAMPFWTDSYYGGQVNVTFAPSNVRQCVSRYMMQFVDDYIIMSYNTDPANAASRVQSQAKYASTLPESSRPRIYGGVETVAGAGATVSYADTAGKQSKAVVLADIQTITKTLSTFSAFHGMNLHAWEGWHALPK